MNNKQEELDGSDVVVNKVIEYGQEQERQRILKIIEERKKVYEKLEPKESNYKGWILVGRIREDEELTQKITNHSQNKQNKHNSKELFVFIQHEFWWL